MADVARKVQEILLEMASRLDEVASSASSSGQREARRGQEEQPQQQGWRDLCTVRPSWRICAQEAAERHAEEEEEAAAADWRVRYCPVCLQRTSVGPGECYNGACEINCPPPPAWESQQLPLPPPPPPAGHSGVWPPAAPPAEPLAAAQSKNVPKGRSNVKSKAKAQGEAQCKTKGQAKAKKGTR